MVVTVLHMQLPKGVYMPNANTSNDTIDDGTSFTCLDYAERVKISGSIEVARTMSYRHAI